MSEPIALNRVTAIASYRNILLIAGITFIALGKFTVKMIGACAVS
jgi:hypothetical protein